MAGKPSKVNIESNIKLDLTFRTVVLPVARAGAIFHATITYMIKCISKTLDVLFNIIKHTKGKFHGVICP